MRKTGSKLRLMNKGFRAPYKHELGEGVTLIKSEIYFDEAGMNVAALFKHSCQGPIVS